MKTQTSFNGTNLIAHVHDPDEENFPSIKFGPAVFTLVFLGIVLVAAMLVITVIYCSRKQEILNAKNKDVKSEEGRQSLLSNLTCKAWSERNETEELSTSSNAPSLGTTDSESSSSGSDYGDDEERQIRTANHGVGTLTKASMKDESTCPICSEEYQYGQLVYESSNPHCRHQCHKVCMDLWLKCQNTCPLCNRPFILQRVQTEPLPKLQNPVVGGSSGELHVDVEVVCLGTDC